MEGTGSYGAALVTAPAELREQLRGLSAAALVRTAAAPLLVAAGDNPGRLRSDACFSMLCGASPIQASSGKTTRHRLNRGGDRQANAALYRIVLVRLCYDPATKDYMARRLKQGKSKKEIIRCLKRYVAREVFAVLNQMGQGSPASAA